MIDLSEFHSTYSSLMLHIRGWSWDPKTVGGTCPRPVGHGLQNGFVDDEWWPAKIGWILLHLNSKHNQRSGMLGPGVVPPCGLLQTAVWLGEPRGCCVLSCGGQHLDVSTHSWILKSGVRAHEKTWLAKRLVSQPSFPAAPWHCRAYCMWAASGPSGYAKFQGQSLVYVFFGSPAQVLGMFRESTSMITSRLSKIN